MSADALAPANPPRAALPRASVRNASIGLIALALFAGTAARYVLSPVQELMRADLGLGDNQVALLQGMAVALPTALIAIPVGRLVDRANRARLLVVLALICVAGTVMTAFAHGFAVAFVARMLVGASVAAAQPAAISLAADLADASTRGRMITLIALGQVLGVAVAYLLAGALLQSLPALVHGLGIVGTLAPWRLLQLAFAAAVLAAAATLALLREPPRLEAGAASGGSVGQALRELWQHRRLLVPMVVGMVTVGMADAAASIWAVPVLTRNFHQTPSSFGVWMGFLNLGCGLLGAVLGGVAADFGQRVSGRGGVLMGAVLGALLSIPAALFPVMPSVALFAVLMAVLLTSGACVSIASASAVTVLLPNEVRGICISMIAGVIGLVAAGIAPLLVSLATQLFGRGDDIAWPLACVGLVTSLAGSVAFVRAMRLVRDSAPAVA